MYYTIFTTIFAIKLHYLILTARSIYDVVYIGLYISLWGLSQILFSDSIYKFKNGIIVKENKIKFCKETNRELFASEAKIITLILLVHSILLVYWLVAINAEPSLIPDRINNLSSNIILASSNVIAFYLMFFGIRGIFIKGKSFVYTIYYLSTVIYNIVVTVYVFLPKKDFVSTPLVFGAIHFGIPMILLCTAMVLTKTGYTKINNLSIELTKDLRKAVSDFGITNEVGDKIKTNIKDGTTQSRWIVIIFSAVLILSFILSIVDIPLSGLSLRVLQVISIMLFIGITSFGMHVELVNAREQNTFYKAIKVGYRDER